MGVASENILPDGNSSEVKEHLLDLPTWLLVLYSVVVGMCTEIVFSIPLSLATTPNEKSC